MGGDRIGLVKRALLAMQRHSWEQGVAAQAFLELGDTGTVVAMAFEAVSRQREDGRLAVVGGNNAVTDPAANGEPVMFAAEMTGDPALREAAKRMLNWLLHRAPRTEDGTLHHIGSKPQGWIDSAGVSSVGLPVYCQSSGHNIRQPAWSVASVD